MSASEKASPALLSLINDNPGIRYTEIEKIFDAEGGNLDVALRILVKRGAIFKGGNRNGGYYPISMLGKDGLKPYRPSTQKRVTRQQLDDHWDPVFFWGHKEYERANC
jgi:predicted transcriptional regulator